MEKAKNAAAAIDQQLNESVGAEHAIAKKKEALALAAAGQGAENGGTSVWNEDDFKFDDDDDQETTTSPIPPPALAPPTPRNFCGSSTGRVGCLGRDGLGK